MVYPKPTKVEEAHRRNPGNMLTLIANCLQGGWRSDQTELWLKWPSDDSE